MPKYLVVFVVPPTSRMRRTFHPYPSFSTAHRPPGNFGNNLLSRSISSGDGSSGLPSRDGLGLPSRDGFGSLPSRDRLGLPSRDGFSTICNKAFVCNLVPEDRPVTVGMPSRDGFGSTIGSVP